MYRNFLKIVVGFFMLFAVLLLFLYHLRERNIQCSVKKMNGMTDITIDGINFKAHIGVDKNEKLENIFITDQQGRKIIISYSRIGILSYEINDDNNYVIKTSFDDNMPIEYTVEAAPIGEQISNEGIYYHEPMTILRFESYYGLEKAYKINYKKSPYFEIIE